MKNYLCILVAALMTVGLASCDDGRLYETETVASSEGRTVNMTVTLTGVSSWPSSQMYIVIAGFNDDSEYAVLSKAVSTSLADGTETTLQLSGISDEVTRVELCAINSLRKYVVSFYTIDESTLKASDEITVNAGSIDVGMFNTIQDQVFNTTCVNCHGGSTFAAAGLYLTEGLSYEAMVGKTSTKQSDMQIVEAGNASNSVLYQALSTEMSIDEEWGYNHTSEVVDQQVLAMIRNWINNGAQE